MITSVLHIPENTDICVRGGNMHIRLRARRGSLSGATLIYCCSKFHWHEHRDEAELTLAFSDSEIDYYSVSVPLTDTRFAYIFYLRFSDGSTGYLSEEGLSESFDHSLGFFSYFQHCSQFPLDTVTTPEWLYGVTCYQIFPERFFIGDTGKDMSYVNQRWGELPTPKSFYGGDLWGIREKLPYLSDLGVGMLYLNPVFRAGSNHKYDTTDYENVDPDFGGNEALRSLISSAHEHGIRVMLDGVFNHTSRRHPFFLDAMERRDKSPWWDWYFISPDGEYRTFANVAEMPKLNTENPEVIEYFSSVAVRWMAEYGADGWRLDVSDEISHRFLRRFREAVLRERPDAIIIGEDWHRSENTLHGDEYDGLMNYAFTKAALDLLAFGTLTPSGFRDRIARLYHCFSVAADEKMLNLLDSHDTDRFLTRVKGDRKKLRLALALLFFYPGIPCVYYGDEIGLEGGYDPDCRRCFDWNEGNWDRETHELVKALTSLKKTPPLARGGFAVTESGGIVSFLRSFGGSTTELRANPTAETRGGIAPYEFVITESN